MTIYLAINMNNVAAKPDLRVSYVYVDKTGTSAMDVAFTITFPSQLRELRYGVTSFFYLSSNITSESNYNYVHCPKDWHDSCCSYVKTATAIVPTVI